MFKIFVGNLDYKVRVEQLRELFSVFAPIEDLVIPVDPKTNRSKGFAIVMIRDPELGHAAVKAMQGKRLMGRSLVINEAVKKKSKEAPVSKADLVRNGPFGPRMYRFGDPRGGNRTNRNPRRPSLGGRPDPGPASSAEPHGAPNQAPVQRPLRPATGPSGTVIPAPSVPRVPPASVAGSIPAGNPAATPPQPIRPKAQRLAQPRPTAEDRREPPPGAP